MGSVAYITIIALLGALDAVRADYVAAVVEYAPQQHSTPNETISANLKEYEYYIGQAREQGVQIIVFPEYGLTGLVGDPTNISIEIPNVGDGYPYANNVLETLANAALANSMYIVFNIAEKAKNDNNETIYYDTNVVIGKDRKIVAKYRKINLFEEFLFTPGNVEENRHVTFVTDFGVTFGVFICFDIAFHVPSRTVLNNSVTDIVFPTAWFSTLPFYQSVSFHYGYAVENRVNLLAANINNVSVGMGGSGIYGADGTIYSYYLSGAANSNKLITANVRTSVFNVKSLPDPDSLGFDIIDGGSGGDNLDNFNISRLFHSQNYRFVNLDVSKLGNVSDQVCDGDFCCQFNLNVTSSNSTAVYKLMAYRGQYPLASNLNGNVKICSLLACESDDVSSCATRNVKQTAQFANVTVTTQTQAAPEEYFVPVTVTTGLLPVFNTTYKSETSNVTRTVTLTTGKSEDRILVFGIYSNGAEGLAVRGAVVMMVVVAVFKALF